MLSKTVFLFFAGITASSAFAQATGAAGSAGAAGASVPMIVGTPAGTVGTPAGVGPGALGVPAGVGNGTPGAPFGSTATPIGGGATFGSATVVPTPGASTQSSRGVLGPAPTSPGVVSSPQQGVVTGNSPFPCVIGSATNPC